jgi:predicted DNA-binding ribbon-helix-helix protein
MHPPTKRSVTIAGHPTSISLEPIFWDGLEAAAAEAGLPINALVARIDVERMEAEVPPNLTSAIRQWLWRWKKGGETAPLSEPSISAPFSAS